MKRVLSIIVIILLTFIVVGCKSNNYVLGQGSSIESNATFFRLEYSAFKGTYEKTKEITNDMQIKIVIYTENTAEEAIFKLIDSTDTAVITLSMTTVTNGTYYYNIVKGTYKIELSSSYHIGGIVIYWNYQGDNHE